MAGPIATAAVQIVPSFNGLHKNTKKALGGLDPEFDKAGKRGGGALSRGVGRVAKAGLVAGGAALAAGLGTALAKGFSRLTAIDEAEAKLRGLGHSAETVETIMTNSLEAVKGTAFGLDEAATVSAALVASGIKPGKDLEATLRTVADSATIAGIGMDEMGAIFGKVASSGRLQGDELNQMSERGIPALQLLSEHLGKTTDEVREMVSKGEVDFETFAAAMDAGMGGAALKSGETFTGAWKNVGAALGRIGATLLTPFFEAAKGGMGGLTAILDSINTALQPVMEGFGQWLNSIDWATVGQQMGQVFAPLWQALQPLIPALLQAWQNLSPIGILLQALAPVGAQLGGVIATLAATVAGVLGQALAFVLPILAELATTIAGVLTNGITAALPVIQMLAQMLGPILAVVLRTLAPIITAVVNVVMQLMRALMPIVNILMSLVAALLPPLMQLFMALAPILVVVGELIGFLARVIGAILVTAINILVPIIRVLANILSVVLVAAVNVVTAILNVLVGIVRGVGAVFSWLWQNIVVPVWNGIRAAIQVAWNLIRPIFNAIVTVLQLSLGVAFKVFEVLVRAVWLAIRIAIEAAWAWIKKWVFDPIVSFLKNTLGPAFTWLRDNVITPVWNGIQDAISTTWNWIKTNVFDPLANAVKKTLPNAFEDGKDAIGKAWDKLKEVAKAPVRFVIETVLNNGLIKKFNEIADKFPGTTKINEISLPKGFRAGGKVWGPGTETSDSIPARLSRNEHVLTAKDVRNLGGHGNVYRLRNAAARGWVPALASGGTLMDAADWWLAKGARGGRHSRFEGYVVKSGHSRNSLHYQDRAVDFNYGPGGRNQTEINFFDRHLAAFKQAFPNIRVIWKAPDGSHWDHLHIDTSRGADIGDFDGAGGGLSLDWFLAPFNALKEKLAGQFEEWGVFGSAVKGMGSKALNAPIEWIKSNIDKVLGFAEDAWDNVTTRAAKEQVRLVANRYGWGSGQQWADLVELVQKESSWDTKAANPTSSARGLFQKMTSIHGPVERTAFGQAEWGLDYIKDRYGSPSAALRFHRANNWYAGGGAVDPVRMPWASTYTGPTKYDDGGWLKPGLQATLNATRKPEAVFTQEQFRVIKAAALGNAGAYSGPQIQFGDVHGHSVDEVADRVITKIRREEAVRGRALL